MLENLDKPVIFTGSQLPIGLLRTDGRENLITAIEIAAARNGLPVVRKCRYSSAMILQEETDHKDECRAFRCIRFT